MSRFLILLFFFNLVFSSIIKCQNQSAKGLYIFAGYGYCSLEGDSPDFESSYFIDVGANYSLKRFVEFVLKAKLTPISVKPGGYYAQNHLYVATRDKFIEYNLSFLTGLKFNIHLGKNFFIVPTGYIGVSNYKRPNFTYITETEFEFILDGREYINSKTKFCYEAGIMLSKKINRLNVSFNVSFVSINSEYINQWRNGYIDKATNITNWGEPTIFIPPIKEVFKGINAGAGLSFRITK